MNDLALVNIGEITSMDETSDVAGLHWGQHTISNQFRLKNTTDQPM